MLNIIAVIRSEHNQLPLWLAIVNIIVASLFTELPTYIASSLSEKNRRKQFYENLAVCINASGKYVGYFKNIPYTKQHDIGIISIIEKATELYCRGKGLIDVTQKDGIRIVFYWQISEDLNDPTRRDQVRDKLRVIITHYNFRGSAANSVSVMKTIAHEFNFGKTHWRKKTLKFLSSIVPSIELFILERQLNQLTRFRDFLRERFAARFSSMPVLEKITKTSMKNCYWVIAKNIDPNIRTFLVRHPIFATKPANSHNFPGFRSLRFSHYLVRVEDPKINNVRELGNKLKSMASNASNMFLSICSINTQDIFMFHPEFDGLSIGARNNIELAKRTILYFTTGVIDMPANISNYEQAVYSGLISLDEIISVVPVSFLTKRMRAIPPKILDKIGILLGQRFHINKLTDWRNVDIEDLYESIIRINKPVELVDCVRGLGEQKLKKICSSIIKNADELNKQLGL